MTPHRSGAPRLVLHQGGLSAPRTDWLDPHHVEERQSSVPPSIVALVCIAWGIVACVTIARTLGVL
jgi:hypothetical protein